MYAKISKQLYQELIKRDFAPFAINIQEDLTNDTMTINLIKLTNNIVYVVCLLNTFRYTPEMCIGKVQLDKSNFTQKYPNTDIKFINIFICKENTRSIEYINKIDENILLDYKDIYWVASTENNKISMYHDKRQPSKLLGIEKILSSVNIEQEEKVENIASITAEALYNSPLRAKFMLFEFYNLIILINVIVSLYVFLNGGFTEQNLLANGAFSYERIVDYHEYYRMFTSLFLHGSFAHLVSNMLTLYIFGRGLETRTSHTNFLGIYFLSGLVANTILLATPSTSIMVGASGCIFGLIGATLVLTAYFNKSIQGLNATNIFTITLINIAVSIMVPEISLSAHIYGLTVGIILGLVYVFDEKRKAK